MPAQIKVIGWQDIGAVPSAGLPYGSIVIHEGDDGLAQHEWDYAGNYSISFFDGTSLTYTGRASMTGSDMSNSYGQMPITGKIIAKETKSPTYVWAGNSGEIYSCLAPGATYFNQYNNSFQSVARKGGYIYAPLLSGEGNSYTLNRTVDSNGTLCFMPQTFLQDRLFISGYFSYSQGSGIIGLRDLQIPDYAYEYPGRIVTGCGFNYSPGYGRIMPNPYGRIFPNSLYDALSSKLIQPEASFPIIPTAINNPYIGQGLVAFTNNTLPPITTSFDSWPEAQYFNATQNGYNIDAFTQNIINYYQNDPTYTHYDKFASRNYVYWTTDNVNATILYYDRTLLRAYPIGIPLPVGNNGTAQACFSCGGFMILAGNNPRHLYVLSIELSDMQAFDTINMSRLRSE